MHQRFASTNAEVPEDSQQMNSCPEVSRSNLIRTLAQPGIWKPSLQDQGLWGLWKGGEGLLILQVWGAKQVQYGKLAF